MRGPTKFPKEVARRYGNFSVIFPPIEVVVICVFMTISFLRSIQESVAD